MAHERRDGGDGRETALVWGCPRIGDVVMSIPALKVLRRRGPSGLFVRYVTTFYAREVAELTGLADDVRPYRLKGGIWNFFRWWKLSSEVRAGAYDHIFVLGKATRFRDKISDSAEAAVREKYGRPHRAERMARTVCRGLGLGEVDTPSPQIDLGEDPAAVEKYRGLGLHPLEDRYLVVHPGTNRLARKNAESEKMWPGEKYGPLLEELSARHPELTTAVVGAEKERAWIERHIVDAAPGSAEVLNLAGETSIGELLPLLTHASALLAVDSGVMHLGTMAGAPLVALFGPTDENEMGPFRSGARTEIIREVELEDARQDPACMEKIGVDRVFKAVSGQISEPAQERIGGETGV